MNYDAGKGAREWAWLGLAMAIWFALGGSLSDLLIALVNAIPELLSMMQRYLFLLEAAR